MSTLCPICGRLPEELDAPGRFSCTSRFHYWAQVEQRARDKREEVAQAFARQSMADQAHYKSERRFGDDSNRYEGEE